MEVILARYSRFSASCKQKKKKKHCHFQTTPHKTTQTAAVTYRDSVLVGHVHFKLVAWQQFGVAVGSLAAGEPSREKLLILAMEATVPTEGRGGRREEGGGRREKEEGGRRRKEGRGGRREEEGRGERKRRREEEGRGGRREEGGGRREEGGRRRKEGRGREDREEGRGVEGKGKKGGDEGEEEKVRRNTGWKSVCI